LRRGKSAAVSPTISVTATCTPRAAPTSDSGSGLDSQRLASLQNSLTFNVAYVSGQAITGAVDGAIGDAFSNGAIPLTINPNGIVLKFSGEPERDPRVEEAFEALSYAAEGKKPVFN